MHKLLIFLLILRPASLLAEEADWSARVELGYGYDSNVAVDDVDLFEVNEAFAVVAMIAMRDLNIPHEKLNIYGGACALGHPIGSSGSRIMATLLAALQDRGQKRGVASLCIGGGEATAVALELI